MASPQQLSIDINKFVAGNKDKLRRFAIAFTQKISENIVEDSPVKTGFFRASWWASINDVSDTPQPGMDAGTLGLVASDLILGDVYRMHNGAAYGMRLEFGFIGVDSLGRHYNQIGKAFVRNNLAAADQVAEDVAQQFAGEQTI